MAAASDDLGCCHWDNAGPEWDAGRRSSASSAVRAGWVLKAKLQDLKESSCNGSHFTKNSEILLSHSSLEAQAIPCLLFPAVCEHGQV